MSVDGAMDLRPIPATPDEGMFGDHLVPGLVEEDCWPACVCECNDIVRSVIDKDV